jgi:hypothetical protein
MLMSGPLVVPTLTGLKTHSCRPVKLPGDPGLRDHWDSQLTIDGDRCHVTSEHAPDTTIALPFGTIGDRLWIRETWARAVGELHNGAPNVVYRAHSFTSSSDKTGVDRHGTQRYVVTWRPSIHMPRWASRIDLEVTDVSVFRVQDITEEIARREGFATDVEHDYTLWIGPRGTQYRTAALAFRDWWTFIYGPESWAANPWVWGIGFKRVQA